MAQAEFITEKQIESILNQVINNFLIPRYKSLGMEASGNWARQLEVRTRPNEGIIIGERYTEQLVYGRRPGTMPPVLAIQRWLQQKGLNLNPWAVAKTIQNSGTSWYRKGGSDLLEVFEEKQTIDFINTQISNLLRVNVQLELVRTAKTILT